MGEISVRRAGAEDATTLARVGREAFWNAYADFSDPADMQIHLDEHFTTVAVAQELGKATVDYRMAMHGEDCVGLIKLRPNAPPESVPADKVLEVQQLYVASSAQRLGVGRRLMDEAMRIARDADIEGIWLSVWADADWATAFYLKCGYERVCDIPFDLGETRFIDWLMWKPAN